MTPSDLYDKLVCKYSTLVVDSICQVETTCRKRGFCAEKQSHQVIDFDEVKNVFYQGKGTPASVDAVCLGDKKQYFCFVELKGWNNYIAHIDKQKDDVKNTAAGYNLRGKLEDSEELCEKIIGDANLFDSMPIVFLLVTDIEVKNDGMEAFADAMFKLAETSTDITSRCVNAAEDILKEQIRIEHDYIYCKEFDSHLAKL